MSALLELVGQLADPSSRPKISQKIAQSLGAETLQIFIKDDELKILLPAPGYLKTIPGWKSWRPFIDQCVKSKTHEGLLHFPNETTQKKAVAIAHNDDLVFILIGGRPDKQKMLEVHNLLPLLSTILKHEKYRSESTEKLIIAEKALLVNNEVMNKLYAARQELQLSLARVQKETEARIITEKELENQRQRLDDLFMQAPAVIAVLQGPKHVFEIANPLYKMLIGERDVVGKTIRKALPELKGQGIFELLDEVYKTGEKYIGNEVMVKLDRKGKGETEDGYYNFVYQPSRNRQGEVDSILIHAVDVTEQVKTRLRVEAQNQVLEMITSGSTLTEALSYLIKSIERQSQHGMIGSVLLMDEDGKHLRHGAAPSLPNEYIKGIDGITIGQGVGSCGTAAYTKKPVIASDIKTDPLWKDFKNLALKYNLRACWSTPVMSGKKVLGTLDLYYQQPHTPNEEERNIVEFAVQTSVLIIEHKRAEEELARSEERFRTLVENFQNLAWIAKPDGWIFWYNKRWYDYTGTTLEEMQGWGWEKVHHPDHIDRIVKFVKEAWHKDEAFELTFPLRRHDGQYRWFLTRVVPVKDKNGKIEQWIGTNTDIEDLRHQHEMEQRMKLLTEQRNALIKINKTKDEFIALASHQLRTPATAVKQYISLLIDEIAGPVSPDQIQFLQTAYDSNERQLNIINDLLKTAQIDGSKYKLDKQIHNVVELVQDTLNDLQTIFEQRSQTIVFSSSNESINTLIDAIEFKLALTNLLENASKYSYTGTKILVSIEKKDKIVEISITDSGVGISKDNQQRIFDKFTRVDNELSDTVTGTGLGLYWVKQITEQHGGSVKLRSTLKKGSIFTVRLPL